MRLLYPNEPASAAVNEENLQNTEAIRALKIPELLYVEEQDILTYMSCNPEVIRHRQALYEDIFNLPELYDILKKLKKYIEDIRDLSFKRKRYSSGADDILYSFGEVSMFADMIEALAADIQTVYPSIRADGFRNLFDALRRIAADENFRSVVEVVAEINRSVHHAQSITLGLNLNKKFEVFEAGIVSINSEAYMSDDIFTRLFAKSEKNGAFRCIMPLVDTKNSGPAFEQTIYNVLNTYIMSSAMYLRSALVNYINSSIADVCMIYGDLKFLLSCSDFVLELKSRKSPMSLPVISDGELTIQGMLPPHLLRKTSVRMLTANDAEFGADTSILILTGPNCGGKSVYVKSVGVCCILMQLGLYVPAVSARIPIHRNFYCHFPAQDSADESRLVEECRRMREILDVLDAESFLLMDESFSGTNSAEGGAIAIEVIKNIRDIGCKCMYSTHFHEVARDAKKLNFRKPYIENLCAEYRNGQRTYSVVKKEPEGYSYAYEIAKEYGLEYNGDE